MRAAMFLSMTRKQSKQQLAAQIFASFGWSRALEGSGIELCDWSKHEEGRGHGGLIAHGKVNSDHSGMVLLGGEVEEGQRMVFIFRGNLSD